ncbi:unnamed protein product, partial [Vitis vinifera]|uniref:Uncharacterized protein n=1 Tax=Vitis vinifera TaxID=29760 RepID=D7TG28_VITVI
MIMNSLCINRAHSQKHKSLESNETPLYCFTSTTIEESPQILALSPPPMFTSRQVLTICNV